MKKLFVDTNVVIDLLSKRLPFYDEAAALFSQADIQRLELSVSALTIANVSYTLLRQMDAQRTKAVLRNLKLIVKVCPLDDRIIERALNDDDFSNFEDALQYYSAISWEQELIITRNLKDFKHSKLPILTARQFLEMNRLF
ncbi:MAG: type II toxin-antitoxin system VapC family toxin [Bacteroidia bacterium]